METAANRNGGIRRALLRPYRVATVLAAVALLLSLGFLAYTAWTSTNRLVPLERHIGHLAGLQQSSMDIQELLIRHFRENSAPEPAEVEKVARRLQALLDDHGALHDDTPGHIRQAMAFLAAPQGNIREGLLAALTVLRRTLKQENELQRVVVAQARRSAELELAVASISLLLLPAIAMFVLAYGRRHSFRSLGRLSQLLENVGNLEFRAATPDDAGDPLAPIYERYNEMAQKLRQAVDEADQREATLERQVRMASETLLRQQAELENGARLAAVGEFAARMAHELRNPISGISLALHNMQRELDDEDMRDRVSLIVSELERVTALLNGLLERGRFAPEDPVPVNLRQLAGDVVRLFGYQLDDRIAIFTDLEDTTCSLPRDTLRQVLVNLLRNASEALAGTGGTIRVAMHRENNRARLCVSDDGPGFPRAMLERGIRPFHSEKETGTGLGMSIVQRLVNAAGGDIEIGTSPEGGAMTTITMTCPD
ncbi:hypothetical protein CSC94_10415 [Zhengella mangrovi]|uniref:histidine kinase n=1 Tax=Zhengella mangrovi TaxID=1982044 RepID=A0A2G1QNC0_9HYPH|nr:ATP-binding protein [Zhengella mangrovi]PHP66964.1 hypothetical protein CSC94_10415 [Zhengella mangrovi]